MNKLWSEYDDWTGDFTLTERGALTFATEFPQFSHLRVVFGYGILK